MRILALCSLAFAVPIAPATAPPPSQGSQTTMPAKVCPMTSYGHGIYKFKCNDGTLFPTELAEFLTEHPSLEVVTVSPIMFHDTAHGYLVVAHEK